MAGTSIIQNRLDASWYLAIAEDLNPRLPIDDELLRLENKGSILGGGDDAIRAARSAVYEAARWAFDGPAQAREMQKGRATTPKYFEALQNRVERILDAYDEINSALSGRNAWVAMNHITEELASRFPDGKHKNVEEHFSLAFREFCSFEECLHHFRKLLSIGKGIVGAKVGRPKEPTYYFVKSLAVDWYKLTGKQPTRVYDPLKEEETGDFYKFCFAAATTVEEVVKFRKLDAAVRRVTEEWKLKDSRNDF